MLRMVNVASLSGISMVNVEVTGLGEMEISDFFEIFIPTN